MSISSITEDEIKAQEYACERADYELEYAKLFLCKHDFDKDEVLNWIREHIYISNKHSYLQGVYSQNQSNASFQDEKQDPEEILNRKVTYDLSRGFGKLEKKDKKIRYRVGYTQQLADEVQSYRNERQLIFDAWRKSNKESAHIIKELLHCMQHRMRAIETKRCMDMVDEVINNAKNYVDKLESNINSETIIPVVKEKQDETDTEKER